MEKENISNNHGERLLAQSSSSRDVSQNRELLRKELNELRRVILCPVCLGTHEEPQILRGCGHLFCRECLRESFRNRPDTCPMCSAHVARRSITAPPQGLLNALLQIKDLVASINDEPDAEAFSVSEQARLREVDQARRTQKYLEQRVRASAGTSTSSATDAGTMPARSFSDSGSTSTRTSTNSEATLEDAALPTFPNLPTIASVSHTHTVAVPVPVPVPVPMESEQESTLGQQSMRSLEKWGVFRPGQSVHVQDRCWVGVNRPGGAAWITSVNDVEQPRHESASSSPVPTTGRVVSYNVRYVLDGRSDQHVLACFVLPLEDVPSSRSRRSSSSSSGSTGSTGSGSSSKSRALDSPSGAVPSAKKPTPAAAHDTKTNAETRKRVTETDTPSVKGTGRGASSDKKKMQRVPLAEVDVVVNASSSAAAAANSTSISNTDCLLSLSSAALRFTTAPSVTAAVTATSTTPATTDKSAHKRKIFFSSDPDDDEGGEDSAGWLVSGPRKKFGPLDAFVSARPSPPAAPVAVAAPAVVAAPATPGLSYGAADAKPFGVLGTDLSEEERELLTAFIRFFSVPRPSSGLAQGPSPSSSSSKTKARQTRTPAVAADIKSSSRESVDTAAGAAAVLLHEESSFRPGVVTHLVGGVRSRSVGAGAPSSSSSAESRGHLTLKKRTMKFLLCMMHGVVIVNPEWLQDSLKAGSILPCAKYVIEAVRERSALPCAPKRAREDFLAHGRSTLFEGLGVWLDGYFPSPDPNREELEELLLAGGAMIFTQADELEDVLQSREVDASGQAVFTLNNAHSRAAVADSTANARSPATAAIKLTRLLVVCHPANPDARPLYKELSSALPLVMLAALKAGQAHVRNFKWVLDAVTNYNSVLVED